MSDLVIEVDSPEQVAAHIRARAQAFPGAVRRALWEEGNITMNLSAQRCPIDTGRLRGSRSVSMPDDTSVALSYGTKYALFVHENISGYWIRPKKARTLHFKIGGKDVFSAAVWMPPNPRAKFLEQPVNERAEAFPAGLMARTEMYIEQGVGSP